MSVVERIPAATFRRSMLERVFDTIKSRAEEVDSGDADIADDVASLASAGLLVAPLVEGLGGFTTGADGGSELCNLLRSLGRANLNVARLWEGHVNAAQLIRLYGSAVQRRRAQATAANGGIFGVWGADGRDPARLRSTPHGFSLSGGKRFCSGVGLIEHAIIPVVNDQGQNQLLFIDVSCSERQNVSTWRTSGMRATASGDFDLDGMEPVSDECLGGPNAYFKEPHFHGGVWRYAAAQTGAIEALATYLRDHLDTRGQLHQPLQRERLGSMMLAAETCRLWVEHAARQIEAVNAPPEAAVLAVSARIEVERRATEAIEFASKAIGAMSYFDGHPVERLRRDLAFYLRQANPDGMFAQAIDNLSSNYGAIGDAVHAWSRRTLDNGHIVPPRPT